VNKLRGDPQNNGEIDQQDFDPYELEKQWQLRPHEEWADRIMALAQDKLSGQARREVEQHLKTCERCTEAYHACRQVVQLLRLAAPREHVIKESGIAYSSEPQAKPHLPPVKMPPGLPRQMREYQEKYVASSPAAPNADPEASDQTKTEATQNDPPATTDQAPSQPSDTAQMKAPGTEVDAFRTIQPLWKDGVVEHHLAEHRSEGRRISLHIVAAPLSQEGLETFQQEAQHLSDLQHPNIVHIVDYGVDNDTPYLALEHITAQSLRKKHRPGEKLPVATIVEYVRQVAEALGYAHKRGVVHRNIKPESLLSTGETVRVSNFGLTAGSLSAGAMKPPEDGAYLFYTAPEQLEGKHTEASDQYALGAVVYEWLTGSPPFNGTFEEVAQHHKKTPPPPPSKKRPNLPPRLDDVLKQALAKKPEHRHPTIQKFAEALIEAVQTVRSEN
jgi:tRNA A-37 threonylcarbamoyl transferase component Bud32/anti-sigma factor RsiW